LVGGVPSQASRLAAALLAERHRWPLWLPVALGTGTALYFASPFEPTSIIAGAIALACLTAGLGAHRSHDPWARAVLALIAAVALGFGNAKGRELRVAAPVVPHPIVTHLTGRVVALDWGRAGLRAVLDDVRSGRLPDPPSRVRVLVRKGGEALGIGHGVDLTAQLMPPPGPAAPGDDDFARAAYFAGVGAVGFVFGAPGIAPLPHAPTLWERISGLVETMRAAMTARIRAQLPDSEGAIASAIITGERGGIDPDDEAALRDAGLAHVLAIAGLHMALVGAGLFWLARAFLALIPALALAYPIKKWAAGLALAGAGFYLLISGGSSSSVRAFVMLGMMLLAVLLDRPALSMRSLALAAAILLLMRPEAITEPGFQMSFAAVASLIAVAEWEQGRERVAPHSYLYRHVRGIALTSLVASLATLPFAMFYFGRATHYAVLGNLLAMPVMGLVAMPFAALSVLAMPFGLEHAPLQAMGWGISLMLALGRWVSGLPGAVTVAPVFPLGALVLMSLGGLWLAIWRRRLRWWGVLPVMVGVVLAVSASRPDLFIAADARTIALRGTDGRLYFPVPPKDHYAAQRWLLRDGDSRPWRDAVNRRLSCDGLGCIAHQNGLTIALSARPEALDQDCARADLVISAMQAFSCEGPRLVLDAKEIASGGGYALRLAPLSAVSINQTRGARPWVQRQ
jgi:competence protein ComEC